MINDCRGADDEDEEIGFDVDPSFEEVPSGWLERCRWDVSCFGRWTRREDILVLEARAWMICVERLCKHINGTKRRRPVLGDNVALVLTQCRWRSRLFARFVVLRRAAAYILARDMVVVSRWIMSEMNTNDAPSRLHGQKQQQEQDAPHSEQAQSEACLAQACVNSAANETYQSTRSMSRHSSEQAALPYPAVGSRHDDLTGCRQARSGADLEGQADDAGHGGTLEAKPYTSLCVGKGHAPDTGAGGTRHVAVLVEAHSQPSRPNWTAARYLKISSSWKQERG